jgi:Trypsin
MKIKHLITSTLTATITAVSVTVTAQAGTIRHDRPDFWYVNYGQRFQSVGLLGLDDGRSGSCSGTLIGSSWVATAAHCIANYEDGLFPRSFTFSVGGWGYRVTNTYLPRGWISTQGNYSAGYDIALLRLRTPVQNIRPTALYTGRNELGKVGTYVGYGSTGTGYTGSQSYDGRKRAGDNTIDRIGGWFNSLLYTDFDNPAWPYGNRMGSPYALNMEYTSAPGDSGGGVFINGLLAGVVSGGIGGSRYGEIAFNTRVSSYASWLNGIMSSSRSGIRMAIPPSNGNSNQSIGRFDAVSSLLTSEETNNLYAPEDAHEISEYELFEDDFESVPEPSTIVGLLSFIALLSLSRRRKQAVS